MFPVQISQFSSTSLRRRLNGSRGRRKRDLNTCSLDENMLELSSTSRGSRHRHRGTFSSVVNAMGRRVYMDGHDGVWSSHTTNTTTNAEHLLIYS